MFLEEYALFFPCETNGVAGCLFAVSSDRFWANARRAVEERAAGAEELEIYVRHTHPRLGSRGGNYRIYKAAVREPKT